jgi:hypothetical protein
MSHTARTALAVALGFVAATAAAADPRADQARRTIRIYDGTEDQSARTAAILVSRQLLDEAGVVADWLDCTAPQEEAGCRAVRGPRDLVIRVAPRSLGPVRPVSDSVSTRQTLTDPDLQLGFATFDVATRRGVLATIFHDRVQTVAQRAALDYHLLLGRAIAHEVGHLLLPAKGHSASGLMRAIWTDDELTQNRREDWVFSAAERDRLRSAF